MDNAFYTESFQEFSSKVGPLDLALYAGAGLIIWVLFQEKLLWIKPLTRNLLNKVKGVVPISTSIGSKPLANKTNNQDIFFDLVLSWKQFRDVAERSGCVKAVEAADQLFPYLSPTVCIKKEVEV